MKKAGYSLRTRHFYLLLAVSLSGIGLLTLYMIAFIASAANPPEIQSQDTTTGYIKTGNPYTPTLQFVSSMGGDHGDMVLTGDYAYVGNGAELSVLDISNPKEAHEVRLLRLPGVIYDLDADSGYLYVASGVAGVLIYDISTPAAPKLITRLQDDFPFYLVYAAGNLLIAINAREFQALDISDPISPVVLDQFDFYFSPDNKLFVRDTYAYIGYKIIDISNTQSLKVVAELDGIVREIDEPYAVVDSVTCFKGCDGYLYLVDISDPTAPILLGGYRISNYVTAVRIEGTRLFAATWAGVDILEISQPLTPTLLSHYLKYDTRGLEISGDRLDILADGLEIIDISNPVNPELLGSYTPVDSTIDYARSGDIYFLRMLYNDDAHRSLHILDAADPENITVLGYAVQFSAVTWVYDFHLEGERGALLAYTPIFQYMNFSDFSAPKFQLWDFNNASAPIYLGGNTVSDLGAVDDLQLTADRAYLMANGQLKILDTSDPTQPSTIMAYGTEGSIGWSRAISNDRVYVSVYTYDYEHGFLDTELQIVDFSNAPAYHILGSYPGGVDRFITALEGTPTRAYLGWRDGGLEILDTSDPANPKLTGIYTSTGVYTTEEEITSLYLTGDLLFSGAYRKFEIIDISDPYSPTLLSRTLIMSGTVEDMTTADGWAYISTGEFGMQVFDVSDPANPVFYKRNPTPTYNVQIIGWLAYLSSRENGLQILSLYEPSIYLPNIQVNGP